MQCGDGYPYHERMDDLEPSAARIRLTGERFDGGRLPIDSLSELENYQVAVRAMAEHQWRRDHPGELLPEDFSGSVGLVIDRIEEGSAIVVLAYEQHVVYGQYQAEAQDAVDATIEAAYGGLALPELPDEVGETVRHALAEIGATLEDGQSIEFYPGGDGHPSVTITIESRADAADRLVLEDFLAQPVLSPTFDVVRQITSLVARVTVVDAEKMKYELNSEEFGRVLGRYRGNPELLDDLRQVVNSTSEGPLTRIHGELRYRGDKPWGFWTTSRVERVEFDDTAWGRALTSFVLLPHGWADGNGDQISSVALDAAQALLRKVDVSAHPPVLAPTEDGGVLIEWLTASGIRSVEILADGEFELFAMQVDDRRGTQTETRSVAEAVLFVNEGEQ